MLSHRVPLLINLILFSMASFFPITNWLCCLFLRLFQQMGI